MLRHTSLHETCHPKLSISSSHHAPRSTLMCLSCLSLHLSPHLPHHVGVHKRLHVHPPVLQHIQQPSSYARQCPSQRPGHPEEAHGNPGSPAIAPLEPPPSARRRHPARLRTVPPRSESCREKDDARAGRCRQQQPKRVAVAVAPPQHRREGRPAAVPCRSQVEPSIRWVSCCDDGRHPRQQTAVLRKTNYSWPRELLL